MRVCKCGGWLVFAWLGKDDKPVYQCVVCHRTQA